MSEGGDQEKTEEPTPKKREEALKQGQFARSSEAVTAVTLLAGSLVLIMNGGAILELLTNRAEFWIGLVATGALGEHDLMVLVRDVMRAVLTAIVPLLLTIVLSSIAYQVAQAGGISAYLERLAPKPSKINPITGLKKILSVRSFVRFGVSLAKLAAIVGVIYGTVRGRFIEVGSFADRAPMDSMSTVLEWVLAVILRVAIALIIIGALDYAYQHWQTEKELKMSKEEVKEERKSSEGDPQVKGRIRGAQKQASRARMMSQVADSDVIVTNPTHYAVALKYREGSFHAPRVVAKGRDLIALRIRELAQENGVPRVEDRPLAQALYRDVEVGDEIPPRFYRAVAVIMAHMWKKKGRVLS